MKFIRIIKVAFCNIKNNKLRSILTMLGLVIGIASVIVLVGIGNGASSNVSSQVKNLGTNILTVKINSSDASLQYSQVDEISKLNNITKAVPYKTVSATINRGTTISSKSSIIATNHNYLEVTNQTISEGRNISEIDIENCSKVCILGNEISTSLFDITDPIGKKIKVNGDNYTVIGILTAQGTSMGNDIDNTILIPITTAKYLKSDTSINNLYVKIADENNISMAQREIENYIRSNLQISSDYYTVSSQNSMLTAMQDINTTLSMLLVGISSISLVVAGIGVMNVMLVSVTERTKEVGIRKALGAKKSDILVQFLIEALILCIIGGTIGIITGIVVGNIFESIGYAFTVSAEAVIISFTSSALIGIIFGIFPAYRAACLKPIEALKTE